MDTITFVAIIVVPSVVAAIMSYLLRSRAITDNDRNEILAKLEGVRATAQTDLLAEINKRTTLELELSRQFSKYESCIDELNNMKNKIDEIIKSQSVKKRMIKVLGIWPEYDGVLYEKIDQLSEIRLLSESAFMYTPLTGDTANRTNIVNELDIDQTINVVQIGAHGVENYIILSKNNGHPFDETHSQWFANAFTGGNCEINLVMLFVCTSTNTVDTLKRSGINCVMGFRKEVADSEIIRFLKPFYKYLASGKSVTDATALALRSFDNKIGDNIIVRGDYTF